jgi:hypothetical protein
MSRDRRSLDLAILVLRAAIHACFLGLVVATCVASPPVPRAAGVAPAARPTLAATEADLDRLIDGLTAKSDAQHAKLDSIEARFDFHESQHVGTDAAVEAINAKLSELDADAGARSDVLAAIAGNARRLARLEIESALLGCGDRCVPPTLRTRAAESGRLEEMLDVVEADIDGLRAQGSSRDLDRAGTWLASARSALASGDPAGAFASACRAYSILSCGHPPR